MNSTAFRIKSATNNTNDAIDMAEADINLKDTIQNWDKETTTFIFNDGSRLVINNADMKAFRK